MDSPDTMSPNNQSPPELNDVAEYNVNPQSSETHESHVFKEQVAENLNKPNVPNVNVPEKIIVCLDICCNNPSSIYSIGDGTTFTSMNMLKRVLDFFIHSKHSINPRAEFALIILKDADAIWVQNFTKNTKEILNCIDSLDSEQCVSETFDFKKVFDVLKKRMDLPEYRCDKNIVPPSCVFRMIVIYTRANCLPRVPQEDEYFLYLRKNIYFYIDILLAHEDDCSTYKCEDVYEALQELDSGYSFVFEVSKNATKIHDCIAKLLAHPFQRPLQRYTDYTFGDKH